MYEHRTFVQGRWSCDADTHLVWSEASSIPMVCTGTLARKQWHLSAVQMGRKCLRPCSSKCTHPKDRNVLGGLLPPHTCAVSIPHNPAARTTTKVRSR